jgi:hypothetical protein
MTAPVASGWSELAGWDLHPLESAAFSRRTPISERGIRDYLTLFSIYQTCAYREIDFLGFLRSGEKKIDAYVDKRER